MGKTERINKIMDNEKYGIELELITNKFRQKMQEVKSAFSSLSDKKVNLTTNTAQIEYLKKQIGELTADLQVNSKTHFWNDTETLKAQAQLEKLKNQYNKLIGKQNEVATSSEKSSSNISKGINKATSKIKRFGFALLSVRSIFSLVSRASSAYLSQDTELAEKMQSAWIGLGAILAPIINFIATLILKLVSVVNKLVKSLTGVDLIAQANAKSMKNASKSANSLKKALAGFDELLNLDSDVNNDALGTNWADAFKNIDEDWAEQMKKTYEGIDTFKQNMIEKLTESVEEAKEIMRKSGFSEEFIDMYDFATNGSIDVLTGFIDTFKGLLEIVDGILSMDKDKIIRGFEDLGSGIWKIISGLAEFIFGAIGMLVTGIIDLVVKGAQWIYNNVLVPIDNWVDEKIRQPIIRVFTEIKDWIYNNIISPIRDWFNNLFGNISSAMEDLNVNLGTGTIGMVEALINKIPRYDIGTNYVPKDQLAMVHKGEAIVPRKFNSQQFFGNDDVNSKLDSVIEAINNIEINPYTTIADVGKASLSYINNKSRQLGESVVV